MKSWKPVIRPLTLVMAVFFVLALLPALSGCRDETPRAVVDFSKVKSTPRPDTNESSGHVLHVAVGAMVSPQETIVYYQQLLAYLGEKTGRSVVLTQKKSYAEVDRLLEHGEIDIAFVCSGPYAALSRETGVRLLAAPQIKGKTTYQAYLIVGRDSPYQSLEDLKGKVFALTDPDSNSGRLVPMLWLADMGQRPESFFSQTIYTYSHDNSIRAVARGLVDGASVDSLVWDYFASREPEISNHIRVIRVSEPFGIPPVVASGQLPKPLALAVQEALLGMHLDGQGANILNNLHIDRFVPAQPQWYDSVRDMLAKLKQAAR